MKLKPVKYTAALIALQIFHYVSLSAQLAPAAATTPQGEAPVGMQWQNGDLQTDGFVGTSAWRAYAELLAGRTPVPVVVAIIDSGTETSHRDLDDVLWVNTDEIPDNGVDDDQNGYVDDIHGWSFIGGPGGNVEQDNLEFTRVYSSLKKRFDKRSPDTISAEEKSDYQRYQKMSAEYANRLEKAGKEKEEYEQLMKFYAMSDEAIRKELGKENYTLEDVRSITPDNDFMGAAVDFITAVFEENLLADLEEYKKHIENQFKYSYNLNFDPRGLVGDDYSNPIERNYGNNHIDGPHAGHGTHVAGIVAAENNDMGMDGICSACRLMIIRCVPDGDERDKDVANSIRYAVDNGARVINMSFGKSLSPEKEVVDEAVRYAEEKGVLLVHAAGNDGDNVDRKGNFPNDRYLNGKTCTTWIEVGASGSDLASLVPSFSNYGKKNVDLFAPGVRVYSTYPDNTFKKEDGTSMAAPVVAGVAGAVLSYFPELSAVQLKSILEKSARRFSKTKVIPGDSNKMVKFSALSKTGGVVNLYDAVKLADKVTGR